MKKLSLVLFSLFISSIYAVDPLPRGYYVSYEKMIKSYIMEEKPYDEQVFTDYILSRNEELSTSEASDISDVLIKVAQCYKIDARLYLGLLRMESNYKRDAVSHTGAVGLTQFTSIGAQEVNDQLGQRGDANANPKVITYLNGLITDCVDPAWEQLWQRRKGWSQQKRLFLKDIELSLVYGATLLKLHLTRYSDDTKPLRDVYFSTLKSYNGEPGDRKIWYAKTILGFFDEMVQDL